MLRTLFRRKCGSSDLRARRNEVRCENSLAYKKRCLNVRSATASRKKNSVDSMQRSNRAMSTNVRFLPTKPNINTRLLNSLAVNATSFPKNQLLIK